MEEVERRRDIVTRFIPEIGQVEKRIMQGEVRDQGTQSYEGTTKKATHTMSTLSDERAVSATFAW